MNEPVIEGRAILHINCRVDMREMRDWESSRIASFFEGIAKAVAAASEHDIEGYVEVKCEAAKTED